MKKTKRKKLVFGIVIFQTIVLALFSMTYRWDRYTSERYCVETGELVKVKGYKSIWHLTGQEEKLESKKHKFSEFLDQGNCERWVERTSKNILDQSQSDFLSDQVVADWYLSSLKELDTNQQFYNIISEAYEENPARVQEFLTRIFDPKNLISWRDMQSLFELPVSWKRKWAMYDDFIENYHVKRAEGEKIAHYYSPQGEQLITWQVDSGTYRHTPLAWQSKNE